jgi:hypothetical protein
MPEASNCFHLKSHIPSFVTGQGGRKVEVGGMKKQKKKALLSG